MSKMIWLAVGLFATTPAVAQLPAGGCGEVPGQGMICSTLFTFKGGLELPVSTIATLPACNAASQGQVRVVTDATTPAYNGALTGGGAVIVLALCNGTAWLAH
jgi:hypothetical protein